MFPCDHAQTFDMIRMFMCNQDTINIFSCQFQRIQSLFYSFSADAYIHQKMGII